MTGERYTIEIEPEVRLRLEDLPAHHYVIVEQKVDRLAENPTTLGEPYTRHLSGKLRELRFDLGGSAQGGTVVNHAEWKTRRHRKLLGEEVEENPEYDRLYEEAELAHDLGQLVYDRRTALGLSQTELAERCGMKQPQISRIEGGGTVPTIPLLRRLARALDAELTIELTPHTQAA
ncbi:helix-turn-helix domain-containing protein [Streptomyces sp. NPDC057027]|uniref:helix-turn-helix domain-containing protein n=1 Tax=Streptomyces sp. NPDC057027 TaxID=3346004 RepID=UPI003627C6BC